MRVWKAAGAACQLIGLGAVAVVIAGALALAIPRLFGLEPYAVMSGSMEPEIMTGAMAYVSACRGEDLSDNDIAAFLDDMGNVVIHRVLRNKIVEGELVTKGDANSAPDMNPVGYDDIIGKVVLDIPGMGLASDLYSGLQGRLWAFFIAICGAVLNTMGGRMRRYDDDAADPEY